MSYPLPDPAIAIEGQLEDILLAMCLFGEARGENDTAKVAIANVIRNRVLSGKYGGDTYHGVILKPYQFSCFLESDPNRAKLLQPTKYEKAEVWSACYDIARFIIEGDACVNDNTIKATHYYSPKAMVPPTAIPKWAKPEYGYVHTVDIGNSKFYRDPNAFVIPNRRV